MPYENCAYVFTYSADLGTIYIELFGQVLDYQNTFLAVGFSNDNEMVRYLLKNQARLLFFRAMIRSRIVPHSMVLPSLVAFRIIQEKAT